MYKIQPSEIQIEKLKQHHNLKGFQSFNKDLQKFLIEDALYNQEQNISVTFLWFYNQTLIGYISLLMDRITLNTGLQQFFKNKGIHYQTLPALKIGRLCVHDHFQKRGLGTLMTYFAVDQAKEIANTKVGCRFLTVDAKSGSEEFYKKIGFKIFKEKNDMTAMYFDILRVLL